jgi:hypothetical protein
MACYLTKYSWTIREGQFLKEFDSKRELSLARMPN